MAWERGMFLPSLGRPFGSFDLFFYFLFFRILSSSLWNTLYRLAVPRVSLLAADYRV